MYENNIEFLMYIDIGIKKKVLTKCILKLIVSYSQDRIFGFFLLWAHTIWAQSKKSAFLYMSNTYLPTFLCSLYVTFLIIFFFNSATREKAMRKRETISIRFLWQWEQRNRRITWWKVNTNAHKRLQLRRKPPLEYKKKIDTHSNT